MVARSTVLASESDGDALCPIRLDVFTDPVTAEDGVTYERGSIAEWIAACQRRGVPLTSPMTQAAMGAALRPDAAMTQRLKALDAEAPASGAAPADEARQMLSSQIFAELDRVMDLAEMEKLGLRAPVIVVVGNESSGKSTVLERLTRTPVLPRDKALCTRAAIRMKLRRGPAKLAEVAVWKRQPAAIVGEAQQVAGARLCKVVKDKMDELVAREKREVVDDHEIVVTIQAPFCPNLDVIDLPGLVAAGRQGSETLPAVTRALAKAVIEAEKAWATFLLVVPATQPANQSLAVGLIQECGVLNKTLGIVTMLDVYRPVGDDDDLEANIVDILQGTAASCIPLPHGWLACSNAGPSKVEFAKFAEGSAEMRRLNRMDVKEVAFLKENLAGAVAGPQGGKLGMVGVRLAVQRFFESFLASDWVPRIRTRLLEHFATLADTNEGLGLPVPRDTAYEPHVVKLRQLLPRVHSAFDLKLLATQTNMEFKLLLLARIKAVCAHPEKDWIKLQEVAVLWKAMADCTARTTASMAEWSGKKFFYLHGADRARKEGAWAREQAAAVMKALVTLTTASLATKLREAVVAAPEAAREVKSLKGKLLSFFGAVTMSTQTNEDQAAVMKLTRFPSLMAAYEQHLAACFAEAAKKFEETARPIVDSLVGCVRATYELDAATKTPQCRLEYRDGAGVVAGVPHDLLQAWQQCVVERVEAVTTAWDVPATAMNESCKPQREAALSEMVKVAEVLDALLRLEAKVKASR